MTYKEATMKDNLVKRKHRHDSERDHKKCHRKRDRSSEDKSDHHRRNKHVHYERKRDYVHHEKSSVKRKENNQEPLDENIPRKKHKSSSQPSQNVPTSKWENDENDSRGSDWRGEEKWGKSDDKTEKKPLENKAKPDFGLSGKLAEEVNTYKGVVIKYSEPPEARKPKRRWRLYPFKGDKSLPTLYIHRQSAYLIGRDRIVVDLPIDHPSCSKQHAVLQYRVVPYVRDNGSKGNRVRPYIIDLESANGTYVNNQKIDPRKYVELLEKDVIKFAYSSREYVLLHEHSKADAEDDNIDILNDNED
ncbi:smad nuclear-interacting protein 1 [Halyomorpha halys]|uniref:smad nuclear-interacting protein 1 n=1 Tax=Halyomorpha halys TaxID=286706 RepID=UPI0006D50E64|nr:smad nuclear-interacting protein 1 [Halyomorpha halys]XP_014272555.1 smad nuclear-interacting protein 1 [Halyomorpha halys]XP_014272556.1 smad nuclear-interacting protein 1 [Halyomorpha halys]